MKTYLRLIRYVKPHLFDLISAFFVMLVSSLTSNLSIAAIIPVVSIIIGNQKITITDKCPAFVQQFVDYLNTIPRADFLAILIWFVIIGSLIREVSLFLQSYLMNKVSYKTIRDIRNDIYTNMIELPVSFFSRSHTGDIISKITYDSTVVRDSISEGLTDLVYQGSLAVGAIVMLVVLVFYFNVPLEMVGVTFVLIPLIMYPAARMGKRLKKISTDHQEAMSDLNTTLYESIQGINIVKAFGMEKYECNKFYSINQRFYKFIMKSQKRIILVSPFTEFVGSCCAAFIIGVGGYKVVTGQLNSGVLIAFLFYILSVVKPFKRLTRVHLLNQNALAAAKRIFALIDEDRTIKDIENPVDTEKFEKSIEFKNVSFSYPGKENLILNNVSLRIKKGEIIAIVGKSGVGKTTLVNLVARFYDTTAGSIFIDDVDIRNIKISSLREKIGIVTQETFLFHDTVRNNIDYGRLDTPFEHVERAAKLANASDFIEQLPQGYDTIIGERGAKLSGGQRQRISIARALLKNPPILILDEATSQLDTESEKQVQEAVDRLIANRTVFVIAHRISTIKHSDRILVIDDGKIVEEGPHEDLYAKSGLYKKLYDMQFSC